VARVAVPHFEEKWSAAMPVPKLCSIDAMPVRDLASFEQEQNGGGMRPAFMTRLVAEGLAEPTAFGMRLQLQMRDDRISGERTGHR
jgi:hypothetical protein